MKLLLSSIAAMSCLLLLAVSSDAFAPGARQQHLASSQRSALQFRTAREGRYFKREHQHTRSSSSLLMAQQFDVSRPQFDLYALRQVRGDALTKYNSLNQSEPLRINLSLLLSLTFASSPWLAQELNGVALTLPQTAVAVVGALGCAYTFVRECQARSRQLTRLEKELQALQLPIKLPTNRLADAAFQKPLPIMPILKALNCRIVAVSGSSEKLRDTLLTFRVLGQRLQQANTFVVVVPTDAEDVRDLLSGEEQRFAWLADPGDLQAWKDYFSILAASSDNDQQNGTSYSFRWFGLTPSGRSFGSGTLEPSWIQVFGKSLPPVEVLDEDDVNVESVASSASSVGRDIMNCQQQFYDALTNGNMDAMMGIMDKQNLDPEVSSVVEQGGRLDSWDNCLEDGARPAGMKVSGCDCYLVDDTTAYSTCVEFPAAIEGSSLLAVQKWKLGDSGWKLQQHQTIPWTVDVPAAGTLICDQRGCVSLVRTNERRTFGGLLG